MRSDPPAFARNGVSVLPQASRSIAPSGASSRASSRPSTAAPGFRASTAPRLLKPNALDTIVQSSIVETLRFYDISVAPRDRCEVVGHVPSSDVVGIIAFEGPNVSGNLTLVVPSAVYHAAIPQKPGVTTHADWTYEITNQVMGGIKNRLIQFQLKLRTHLPSVLSGVALEWHKRRTAAEVLYSFVALRGEVCLIIDASLARAPLEYSNAALVVSSNEPPLFG